MKCPHCGVAFHEDWFPNHITHRGNQTGWIYRSTKCPACTDQTIEIKYNVASFDWLQVWPRSATRGPVPSSVPKHVAEDYVEACNVLSISPKASAALARRCLQSILHEQGYKDRDLAKEVQRVLDETDPSKAIPQSLRLTIDGVRNFGNFSAHPINDQTTLQIVAVEPHEAEWCLAVW
jgi:hypothetical protein